MTCYNTQTYERGPGGMCRSRHSQARPNMPWQSADAVLNESATKTVEMITSGILQELCDLMWVAGPQ